MKRIIGFIFGFIVFLCCFGESLYLTQEKCDSQIGKNCNNTWRLQTCTVNGSYIYLLGVNTNGIQSTGTVAFCKGKVYGKTGGLSGIGDGCYGYKKCCIGEVYGTGNNTKCCESGKTVITSGNNQKCKSCGSLTAQEISSNPAAASACNQTGCSEDKKYALPNGLSGCCEGIVESGVCNPSLGEYGINVDPECLLNGQCSLNVYKVVGIRQSNENPTVLGFFQDITLASTTVVLGTVLVIAMIIGGLSWSIASITGKDTKKGKTIVMSCFVGLLLIMGSYAIIRLIQFLATAGS